MRVIVVGAGIIGAATAWQLRRRGAQVTLADPTPGQGATHAAGGMLAAISEVQYGQDRLYPLMLESAAEYPDLIAALAADTDLPTGHDTTGTLVVAADPADRDTLAQLAQVQHRHGMAVDELTGRAVRRLEPALGPRVVAGFHTPDDHQVDPRALVAALLDAATREDRPGLAARLIRRPVTEWVAEAEQPTVRFADGSTASADVVVLAPGLGLADIAGLPAVAHLPQRPVFGDVVRLGIPPRLLVPGEERLLQHTVRGLVHGVPVYLVPRADGQLVLGATSREDATPAVSAGGVYRLLRDASTLVPALLEAELIETLARARPGSPDDLPVIGQVAPGLVVSAGYFRHGILLAALGSRLTADVVCGTVRAEDEQHLAAASPLRFDRSERLARPVSAPPSPAGARLEHADSDAVQEGVPR